ncbi:DUF6384 family protein [Devosia rhodophyticola]|uniref:DUF6384 family protein n=1 Tax=Devosia rhodophyticola TaxID=3026423 RepID=A0ABY7Z0D6_9HYPH|nr:DUF6384 family protein [Devosia rhodophyticola]WDR06793.1 DUF6384 family protein [Devosia rhodophyticola]
MSETTATTSAPLDEVMLAMDVVDTLRHRQDLATRELAGATRESQLIDKLREIYRQQGIDVPDHILKEGVSALAESRFVYTPPPSGFGTTMARLYVGRSRWLPKAIGAVAVLLLLLGGYFLGYQPYQAHQREVAHLELTQELPARLEELYQTIFNETKVQQAEVEAEDLLKRGKAYAAEGNRAQAEEMANRLTALRDQLRQEYTLRVVNRPDTLSVFWRFPENNSAATNYYIVVEAVDPNGNLLSFPIRNEENGETETVNIWGLRVPESVYRSVAADKTDNGIIERDTVGLKSDGFMDIEYTVPVLGGTVTQW